MLHNLRWKLILRFVDIDEIADHHCLTFVFISRLKVDSQNANNQLVDKHWKNLGRQALQKSCWSTSTAKSPLVDTTKTSSRSTNTKNQQQVGEHKTSIPSVDKNHTFRYTGDKHHGNNQLVGKYKINIALGDKHKSTTADSRSNNNMHLPHWSTNKYNKSNLGRNTLRARSCWQTRKATYWLSNNVHTVIWSINPMQAAHWPTDIQISIPLYKME